MKVIIDTNIVVSAAIADKNPEAVILFVIAILLLSGLYRQRLSQSIRKF